MAWRVGQEMTPILVTGCNNSSKGFTLIEILVVLIIISIASSFIFINLSSIESVSKNQSSFNKSFNYISEESIITCLLYTSPSPRDVEESRMPSSA